MVPACSRKPRLHLPPPLPAPRSNIVKCLGVVQLHPDSPGGRAMGYHETVGGMVLELCEVSARVHA